jgi:hypothetical protein
MATAKAQAPAQSEQVVSVPEAAATLGAALAVLEDVRRTPGATGAGLIAARADVELAEHRLELARRWEDAAPARERDAKLAVLERRVQAVYTRQARREAEAMRLRAAYDDAYRGIDSDNAEIDDIVAELRLLGVGNDHEGPAEWGQIRYGGGVRVGDASMCRQALPTLGLPWLPYTNPGRLPPPAAPAPVGCPHHNVARRAEQMDRASGQWGARVCLDCGEQLSPPDPTYAPPAPPSGDPLIIGPDGRSGSLPLGPVR